MKTCEFCDHPESWHKLPVEECKSVICQCERNEEQGECDSCGKQYDLSSRDGRCGDCGDCSDCCEHVIDCSNCDETINLEDDYAFFLGEGAICQSCEASEYEHRSTIVFFDGESGAITTYSVTDLFAVENENCELVENMHRVWRSQDGWRGYYDTVIEGMVEVAGMTGWTSGWLDEAHAYKVPFREWATLVHEGVILPPVDVAIVADPTSNVFSTAMSVQVKTEDMDAFIKWLGDDLQTLQEALR